MAESSESFPNSKNVASNPSKVDISQPQNTRENRPDPTVSDRQSSECESSTKNLASSSAEADKSQPQTDTFESTPSLCSFDTPLAKCESSSKNLASSSIEANRSQPPNDTLENRPDLCFFNLWTECEISSKYLPSSSVEADESQSQNDTCQNKLCRYPSDWQTSFKNQASSPVEAEASQLQNDFLQNDRSFDRQMIHWEHVSKYLASNPVGTRGFQPQNDTFKNGRGLCSLARQFTYNESSSENLASSPFEADGSQGQNDPLESVPRLRCFDWQWAECESSLKNAASSPVEADAAQLQNETLESRPDPCSVDWQSTKCEVKERLKSAQLQNETLESRPDPCSVDWQSTKCEVKERLKFIFNDQCLCDVHFIVGSGSKTQKISAHKLILSIGSVVFQTGFNERWSDNDAEIEVTDVEPAIFRELLKFLYFDQVTITAETVVAMWYVAHKYAVQALENKCIDFLFNHSCLENIFNILDEAQKFNGEALKNGCLEAISSNTFDAVWATGFYNLDVETLCSILQRSDLIIGEIDLFEAVLRWSEAACKRENLPVRPQNQRAVLKNAVSLLRFPLMWPDDFSSKVVESGLLSETEVLSMLLYFTKKSKPTVSFGEIPRRGLFVVNRYPNEYPTGVYGGAKSFHSLGICSDCDIYLCGVALYGSPIEPVTYSIQVSLRCHLSFEVLSQDSRIYNGTEEIFRVMLKKPVRLTANTHYRLEVTIQGTYSVYGRGGSNHITVNLPMDRKVKISFFNTYESCSSHAPLGSKTFFSNGQIPKLLFCL